MKKKLFFIITFAYVYLLTTVDEQLHVRKMMQTKTTYAEWDQIEIEIQTSEEKGNHLVKM